MKKTTKSMLITALILFCAGLLLALGSALFVKIRGIDPFGVPDIINVIENKEFSLNDILANSPESNFMKKLSKKEYSRIQLISYSGNIEICSTDGETRVELIDANTSNLKVEIIGETLTVEEIDGVNIMGIHLNREGFSFKGLRQIFNAGNSANSSRIIRIYLSKNIAVDQIDVSSIDGDIKIDAVSAELLNIDADFGNIDIKELSASSGRVNINGNINNVTLSNLKNIISATVSVKFGNIEANIGGNTEFTSTLETWIGNVTIKTKEPTTFYRLSLSTSIGEILRNGSSFGKKLSDSSTTANRVTSTTVLGDISIAFQDGDESKYEVPEDPTQTEEQTDTSDGAVAVNPQDN